MKVNRRDFIRGAGAGSLALGSLPALMDILKQPVFGQMAAQTERAAFFLAVDVAGEGPSRHGLAMGGVARFDPSKGSASPVTGGGSFTHWQFGERPPFTLVASGKWTPRLLVSYREIGTYAGVASGTGEFVVDIQRLRPSPALIRGAVLTVYCNLGFAGLTTGQIEGYTLSIPGTEFAAGGTPGPFRQIPAPNTTGVTVYLLPESIG